MFSLLYFTLIFFKLTQDEFEYESKGKASSLGAASGLLLPLPASSLFLSSSSCWFLGSDLILDEVSCWLALNSV